MKISKSILLGAVLMMIVTSCGISPQAACKEIIAETCKKIVECVLPKLSDQAKAFFPYKDQASCETSLGNTSNCDNPNATCQDGKTYSPTQAKKCVDEYKALTCDDFSNSGQVQGNKAPSCQTVCQ